MHNKKLLSILMLLLPMYANASGDYTIAIQQLDDQISKLRAQNQADIEELQECEKNVKGFKIAGITTLSLTGVGVGVNIGQAVKLNKLKEQSTSLDSDITNKKATLEAEKARLAEEAAKKAEEERLLQEQQKQEQQKQEEPKQEEPKQEEKKQDKNKNKTCEAGKDANRQSLITFLKQLQKNGTVTYNKPWAAPSSAEYGHWEVGMKYQGIQTKIYGLAGCFQNKRCRCSMLEIEPWSNGVIYEVDVGNNYIERPGEQNNCSDTCPNRCANQFSAMFADMIKHIYKEVKICKNDTPNKGQFKPKKLPADWIVQNPTPVTPKQPVNLTEQSITDVFKDVNVNITQGKKLITLWAQQNNLGNITCEDSYTKSNNDYTIICKTATTKYSILFDDLEESFKATANKSIAKKVCELMGGTKKTETDTGLSPSIRCDLSNGGCSETLNPALKAFEEFSAERKYVYSASATAHQTLAYSYCAIKW